MVKRWNIRGVFMLPVLLCLMAWAWSYGHGDAVTFATDQRLRTAVSEGGSLRLLSCPPWLMGGSAPGWHFYDSAVPAGQRRILVHGADYLVPLYLGFAWQRFPSTPASRSAWYLAIPYYLPLAVFSLLLVFAWRCTRPRPPLPAFPVETPGTADAA